MLVVCKQNHIEKWFAKKISFIDCFLLTSYRCFGGYCKNSFLFKRIVKYTVVNDLSYEPGDIFAKMKQNTRNEINRAIKIGVTCEFNLDCYAEFVNFYNNNSHLNDSNCLKYRDIESYFGNLCLNAVYCDNILLGYHLYIVSNDDLYVRLLYSSRNSNYDSKIVGFANRLLHYYDMIYFKKLRFICYDFGGCALSSSSKKLNNIRKFKQDFGGKLIQYDEYMSFLLYILLKVRDNCRAIYYSIR